MTLRNAIEARSGETEGLDPKGESAVTRSGMRPHLGCHRIFASQRIQGLPTMPQYTVTLDRIEHYRVSVTVKASSEEEARHRAMNSKVSDEDFTFHERGPVSAMSAVRTTR